MPSPQEVLLLELPGEGPGGRKAGRGDHARWVSLIAACGERGASRSCAIDRDATVVDLPLLLSGPTADRGRQAALHRGDRGRRLDPVTERWRPETAVHERRRQQSCSCE